MNCRSNTLLAALSTALGALVLISVNWLAVLLLFSLAGLVLSFLCWADDQRRSDRSRALREKDASYQNVYQLPSRV